MSSISIRLDDRDSTLIRRYAKMKKMTITDLVREAVLEHIEDEIDLDAFDHAFKSMTHTYSIDEVKSELGL